MYQLTPALSIIGEHFNNGNMEIRINKKSINYFKSRIHYAILRSRHSSSAKYNVYVKYVLCLIIWKIFRIYS